MKDGKEIAFTSRCHGNISLMPLYIYSPTKLESCSKIHGSFDPVEQQLAIRPPLRRCATLEEQRRYQGSLEGTSEPNPNVTRQS